MTGKLQETLEETQRRLALGSVTTVPMLQTLDNRHRARSGPSATRVFTVIGIILGIVVLVLVGLFAVGVFSDGGSGSGEVAALTVALALR
jgi:hypothetical protein